MDAERWWSPVALGLVVGLTVVALAEVGGVAAAIHPDASSRGAVVRPTHAVEPAQVELAEAAPSPTPLLSASEPVPTRAPDVPPRAVAEPAAPQPSPDPSPEAVGAKPPVTRTVAPTPTPTPTPSPILRPTAEPTPSIRPIETLAAPTPTRTPPPAPTASPTPARPSPAPSPIPSAKPKPIVVRPAQVLDLRAWKLTLPTGRSGRPREVKQPELDVFGGNASFRLDAARRGVVFRATVGGVTTPNSSYPRAELREMSADGRRKAGWTNEAGRHAMTITQAITATPRAKPHVVAGQIHDGDDDVVMIRLEGRRLFVESDGDEVGLLDADYGLGTRFTISLVATLSGIHITYNDSRRVHVRRVGRGWYFKAGCYTQSNPSKGDAPDAYGEVVIHALSVRHSLA